VPRPRIDSKEALRTEQVTVAFQGLKAVDGVDFQLRQGEILGLIGPNGAGKTTLLNVLSGFERPKQGSVLAGTRDITGWPVNQIAALGIGRTFQSGRLFGRLSVVENVLVAALSQGLPTRDARALCHSLLETMELVPYAEIQAKSLPYGLARRLGIARALGLQPRFLLLDEPAAGLNELESAHLMSVLKQLREERGLGLLVIEHDMPLIMRMCDRLHVLDHGKTLAVGTPKDIQADPKVRSAYLGTILN
jgi:branched-chain amino acid transport system ATP-binding protein